MGSPSFGIIRSVKPAGKFPNRVESLGSGIARIIGPCRKAGLRTPLFEHRGAAFVVTILKNRWTKAALSSLGLNERQIAAVEHVKNAESITLRTYLALTSAPHRTAVRELQGLVAVVGDEMVKYSNSCARCAAREI